MLFLHKFANACINLALCLNPFNYYSSQPLPQSSGAPVRADIRSACAYKPRTKNCAYSRMLSQIKHINQKMMVHKNARNIKISDLLQLFSVQNTNNLSDVHTHATTLEEIIILRLAQSSTFAHLELQEKNLPPELFDKVINRIKNITQAVRQKEETAPTQIKNKREYEETFKEYNRYSDQTDIDFFDHYRRVFLSSSSKKSKIFVLSMIAHMINHWHKHHVMVKIFRKNSNYWGDQVKIKMINEDDTCDTYTLCQDTVKKALSVYIDYFNSSLNCFSQKIRHEELIKSYVMAFDWHLCLTKKNLQPYNTTVPLMRLFIKTRLLQFYYLFGKAHKHTLWCLMERNTITDFPGIHTELQEYLTTVIKQEKYPETFGVPDIFHTYMHSKQTNIPLLLKSHAKWSLCFFKPQGHNSLSIKSTLPYIFVATENGIGKTTYIHDAYQSFRETLMQTETVLAKKPYKIAKVWNNSLCKKTEKENLTFINRIKETESLINERKRLLPDVDALPDSIIQTKLYPYVYKNLDNTTKLFISRYTYKINDYLEELESYLKNF